MEFMGVKIGWPLDKNIIRRGTESNTFGLVRRNTDLSPRPHQGWDLYAASGTPVYSVSDGKVVYAGTYGALGKLLIVTLGDSGKYVAYAHLSAIRVRENDRVRLGDPVAFTGNTGNAEDMKGMDQHLHLEIRDKVFPGLGLGDRISPYALYKHIPYKTAVSRV